MTDRLLVSCGVPGRAALRVRLPRGQLLHAQLAVGRPRDGGEKQRKAPAGSRRVKGNTERLRVYVDRTSLPWPRSTGSP